MKSKIFRTDNRQLKQVNRQLKMKDPTENYMTKMDLIDSHPELFDKRGKKLKFSQQEIQLLRTLAKRKPSGSSIPRKSRLGAQRDYSEEKIINLELPDINKYEKLYPQGSTNDHDEWFEKRSEVKQQ